MPVMPKEGTDCHRLLVAMMRGPVTNPNSWLNLMAHSRASDLRKMGWDVQVKRCPSRSENVRKASYVYSLVTPPEEWPDAVGVGAG